MVLPCYNEGPNLAPLVQRYQAAAPAGLAWELLLVDNGSTDGSAGILAGLAAQHAFVRVVAVARNIGYGHGLAQGLEAAQGRILAFSHADQQCDPADVFRAYGLAKDDERLIVKGRRQRRALSQQLLTWGMGLWCSAWLWKPLSDINAQPKAFHRGLLPGLRPLPDGFELDLHVLYGALALGWRQASIPVHFAARGHGQSKWAAHTVLRWRTILGVWLHSLRLRFRSFT